MLHRIAPFLVPLVRTFLISSTKHGGRFLIRVAWVPPWPLLPESLVTDTHSAQRRLSKTYRNQNWLAACVMAGAAAESILLAVAIAKIGDEKKVLTTYNGAGGRSRTTKLVTQGVTASIQQTFETALGVLHYWRDDAAHGMAAALGETEAHEALSRLLRLAQFATSLGLSLPAQKVLSPERHHVALFRRRRALAIGRPIDHQPAPLLPHTHRQSVASLPELFDRLCPQVDRDRAAWTPAI
jgi:hypothetical protein